MHLLFRHYVGGGEEEENKTILERSSFHQNLNKL